MGWLLSQQLTLAVQQNCWSKDQPTEDTKQLSSYIKTIKSVTKTDKMAQKCEKVPIYSIFSESLLNQALIVA